MRRIHRRKLALAAAVILFAACSAGGKSTGPPNAQPPGPPASEGSAPQTLAPATAGPVTTSSIVPVACTGQPQWLPLGEPGTGGWGTTVALSSERNVLLSGGDVFGISRSADGGASWTPSSGIPTYEIERLVRAPGAAHTVWAGTLSGPALSVDDGRTWQLRRTGLPDVSTTNYSAPISALVIDPGDAAHVLAFVGSVRLTEDGDIGPTVSADDLGTVWETTDQGANWSEVGTVLAGQPVTDAIGLPDGTLLAGVYEHGVFRSIDGGRSWTSAALAGANVRDLDASTAGDLIVAAVGSLATKGNAKPGSVYRSTDGGSTFTESAGGLPPSAVASDPDQVRNMRAVRIAPSAPNVVYAADSAYGVQATYRSDDGGTSWVKLLGADTTQPTRFYSTVVTVHAIDVDPNDPDRVVLSANEYVMESIDGGKTWHDLGSTALDGGSFAGRGLSGLVTNTAVFGTGDRIVLSALDGGNLIESTDGGGSWRRPIAGSDPFNGSFGAALQPVTGTIVVGLGQPPQPFAGIARSTTPGTWDILDPGADGLPGGDAGTGTAITAAPGGFLAVIGGALYRSTDDGVTWAHLDGPADVVEARSSGSDGALIWLSDETRLYAGDGSTVFGAVSGGPASIRNLTPDPTDPATVWVSSRSSDTPGVWRYDSTRGWANVFGDPTTFDVAVDPTDTNRLVVVTSDEPYHDEMASTGVWCSLDRGASWNQISAGLPITRVRSASFDPRRAGHLIIGSNGMGFFQTELGR